MNIETVTKSDYLTLIQIWEASVRATHDFLKESDIQELKPLILEHYFDAVDLRCAKNEQGKIVGAKLAANAIETQGATKVDVNEQNLQAVGFYKHIGFKQVGRSELDGQGKPYPLLHMALA